MPVKIDVEEAQQRIFQVRQEVEKLAFYLRGVGLELGADDCPEDFDLPEPGTDTKRWFVGGTALSVSEEMVALAGKLFEAARLTDASLRERWEGEQTADVEA